jgi:hypothetical protein
MRSKHHNINPPLANLSHVVNSLSFGPILPKQAMRRLSIIPATYFTFDSTQPMNNHYYPNNKLHQAFHHYIKVRRILVSFSPVLIGVLPVLLS